MVVSPMEGFVLSPAAMSLVFSSFAKRVYW